MRFKVSFGVYVKVKPLKLRSSYYVSTQIMTVIGEVEFWQFL